MTEPVGQRPEVTRELRLGTDPTDHGLQRMPARLAFRGEDVFQPTTICSDHRVAEALAGASAGLALENRNRGPPLRPRRRGRWPTAASRRPGSIIAMPSTRIRPFNSSITVASNRRRVWANHQSIGPAADCLTGSGGRRSGYRWPPYSEWRRESHSMISSPVTFDREPYSRCKASSVLLSR